MNHNTCFPWAHKWTKWSNPVSSNWGSSKLQQWRKCMRCNKAQSRNMDSEYNATEKIINEAFEKLNIGENK